MKILWLTHKGDQWPVMLDDSDYDAVVAAGPWHLVQDGITRFYVHRNQKPYLLHRFLMGVTDPKVIVDHRDRNPLNNKRSNLRFASASQNSANQRKSTHSSRFRGVTWAKTRRKWQAQIGDNGKYRYLGYFTDEKLAACAYDDAAREIFGEFAVCNFRQK